MSEVYLRDELELIDRIIVAVASEITTIDTYEQVSAVFDVAEAIVKERRKRYPQRR
jgi:hypothetical protein